LLAEEGVPIIDGYVVDLPSRLFTHFDIEPLLTKMRLRQEELSPSVIVEDDFPEPSSFSGLDMAYQGNDAFGVRVDQDASSGRITGSTFKNGPVRFPYVPTYLTYRELPILAQLIDRERQDIVYLIDGQGMLHPRRFGIACHMGVCLDIPTIGVAKSLLVGKVEENGREESPIMVEGTMIGCRLSIPYHKPLYISVGNRVSLQTAVEIVKKATMKKESDPLRIADRLSKEQRKSRSSMEE
jgi:deoxyribonuclease V